MTTVPYSSKTPMRVALAGIGNVGRQLVERLGAGAIPEVRLTAVADKDQDKAREAVSALDPAPVVVPVAELADHADVVVECATTDAFPEIAHAVLTAGKTLVAVSVGAVAANPDMIDLAAEHGGRIRIANGTMVGMDALRGAAEGTVRSVALRSRIRPDSFVREQYILDQGLDFTTPPAEAVKVFEGTAREAALAFPKHFNVAVTVSLAGIGFERTTVEVWADPDIPGAIHQIDVDAEDINITTISRNLPSANPRTSRIVAPSIIATLRSMVTPLQVGT